jgi:hypothetical protein
MTMSAENNPVYSKNVIEFVTVAKEYCEFVEQAEKPELRDFVDKAHKILPLLYLKGTLLPDLDAKYEDFNERFVTEKEYENVRKKIIGKLKQFDSYQEIFDPVKKGSNEPAGASISEDMSDIFQVIKDFVLLYKVGQKEVMYEAIWECHQSFQNYWGQRLTNALRALHFLRYTSEDLGEGLEHDSDIGEDLHIDDIDTTDWIITRREEESQK